MRTIATTTTTKHYSGPRRKKSTANDSPAPVVAAVITAATRRLVDDIREPFRGFVGEMSAVLISRAKLAPKFMKAANAWRKETNGTFIAFVRELDATVPERQADYRNNAVYNAAIYLKRLVEAEARGEEKKEVRRGPQPLPPLAGLARLLAAIATLIPEDSREKLFAVVGNELHWSVDQQNRLQRLVEESPPLIAVRAPKGEERPVLHIVQPRHDQTSAVA